ncbi:hypothetical protein FQZ97_1031210 [compost metagenome]
MCQKKAEPSVVVISSRAPSTSKAASWVSMVLNWRVSWLVSALSSWITAGSTSVHERSATAGLPIRLAWLASASFHCDSVSTDTCSPLLVVA